MSNIDNMEKLSLLFVPLFNICLLLINTVIITSIFGNQVIAQNTIFDKAISKINSLANFVFFLNFNHNYNLHNMEDNA